MSDAVIQLEDLGKTYFLGAQEVRALRGISVTFGRGSFWAIMGSSGSGKSTMLNLLGCLDQPTAGRYLLNGEDVAGLDDDARSDIRLRNIGFVFQSFNLVPQLSLRENIELPLFYLGMESHRMARRAGELAEMVGLADRLHHRPAELSGGQQQRAAIARALANDPSVILADEPTGNLDSATGLQIMEMLAGLHRDGKTIIMVTHEQDIAAYAQQRLHLRDGGIASVEGDGP